jgi:hypothetical protein
MVAMPPRLLPKPLTAKKADNDIAPAQGNLRRLFIVAEWKPVEGLENVQLVD